MPLNEEQKAEFLRQAVKIKALMPERPEMPEDARMRMRAKFAARDPAVGPYAHMPDEWVANNVYMLQRVDLDFPAIVEAARDRIMHLSLELAELKHRIQGLEK